MKAYRVLSDQGIRAIELVTLPEPAVAAGQVLVGMKAASLNFRDLLVSRGGYPRNDTRPVIPLSDAAGEVLVVGAGVTRWKAGDRVAGNFMRDWVSGPATETALRSSLGGGVDGMLAERVLLPEHALVAVPAHLDYAEAATLPCAALTAWNALTAAGTKAGDTVLVLGTGGVSVFGLQLAKAMGARVIATSGDEKKAERMKSLGASAVINYKSEPEWHKPVRELTDGRGVDHVLEVGGAGTLERSMKATRIGGTISLIGLLAQAAPPSILPAMINVQTIRGIYVGSVEMFEAMNRAIGVAGIRPVIDRTFAFKDALAAYESFEKQTHFGKVVIAF